MVENFHLIRSKSWTCAVNCSVNIALRKHHLRLQAPLIIHPPLFTLSSNTHTYTQKHKNAVHTFATHTRTYLTKHAQTSTHSEKKRHTRHFGTSWFRFESDTHTLARSRLYVTGISAAYDRGSHDCGLAETTKRIFHTVVHRVSIKLRARTLM